MKIEKNISEEEIQVALRGFKKAGGLIHKLPNEIVPTSLLVGKKYGQFENLMEHYLTGDFSAPY